jgi:hypothetical protein
MRANEFINEGTKTQLHKDHEGPMPGVYNFRDDGIDRTYNLNRIMMAAAMADGKSTAPIKGAHSSSWNDKYNTAHPYTEEEHMMLKQAFNTVPSNTHHMVSDHRSIEPEDTHKTSPVTGFKGYKRK